jgi:hypothetical protein
VNRVWPALVLLVAGCAADFDHPSVVLDLRVLAIRADPPELVLGDSLPPVDLQALVADPRDPQRTVRYHWHACGVTDDLRCASAPYELDLGGGDAPMDAISATLQIDGGLEDSARDLDPFEGFLGTFFVTELTLGSSSGDATDAIKQVPAVTGIPPGPDHVPNRNPRSPEVQHDGTDWPADQTLVVAPGTEVSIEPVSPPADAEHYAVYRFDLDVQELDEHLSYDFFATAGSWSRDRSGGSPDPLATETSLASRWSAPPQTLDQPVTIWIVVRDGRGGTGWTSRRITVSEP